MNVTLGLAQIDPKLGDLAGNLNHHLAVMEEAKAQGVDLLVFPELSLTGYYLQDLVFEVSARPSAGDPLFDPLLAASRAHGMDVSVGFVEED
ncbi:MAG: NAD+ synthetase, partial [Chloroflexi bacterium]|nr:NAD+ synthetase [Chloroflexota bacterium]